MATAAPEVTPLLNRGRGMPVLTPPKRGMNPVGIMLLVVVVLLVVVGVSRSMLKPKAAKTTVSVVGAAVDLPAGCRISYTSLHYVEIPNKYLTPSMVTSSEQIVGRVSKLFVPAGEPITTDALMPANGTLSSTFETNERAITLKLDDEALLDHSIFPNDYVDVLCTATKDGKKYTKTICQQVRVLMSVTKDAMLGNRTRGNEQNRITLAVTPEQSEVLAEAEEIGKVRLVMRSRLSRLNHDLNGVAEQDLLPAKAFNAIKEATAALPKLNPLQLMPAPPPPFSQMMPEPPNEIAAAPPVSNALQWVVEVFSGSKKESYAFPQTQK